MKKIQAFTKGQLEDQEVLREITKKVDYLLRYDNGITGEEVVEYNILRLNLEESLRKFGSGLNQDLAKKYLEFLVKIGFVQLSLLSDEKAIDLFRKHFLVIIKTSIKWEINLENKLRAKVFGISNIWKRDPFLKNIREALKENIEILGDSQIIIGSNNKPKEPSVRNWLADYDNLIGAGEHGELDISNYLFKSKNVRILSFEDKMILKKILRLYEKLKLDMAHPNGIATYPLSVFGIREVGTGLDKKYMPLDPEEYKKEIEKRKKAREEKKKIIRGEMREDSNLLGVKGSLLRNDEKNVPQTLSKPRSDYDLIKEKKFANLNPIPKISLAKLATVQSLEKLNIEDFRSYGKEAEAAGAFMSAKIKKLLVESSESKEAVKYYLRRSELYKIYLLQGKESLDSKKDIGKIAEERKGRGEKYLSKDEFEEMRKVLKSI